MNKPRPFAAEILQRTEELRERIRPVIVAIDGRAGAGKTKLAEELREADGYPIIHMDDFFLLPDERTEERMNTPGGNVAYERVLRDVLVPIKEGKAARYQPYDCQSGGLGPFTAVGAAPVVILEGSYAMHPKLREYEDLTVFVDVEPEEQIRRLKKREGQKVKKFQEKWIPLEEAYIAEYHPDETADMRTDTTHQKNT